MSCLHSIAQTTHKNIQRRVLAIEPHYVFVDDQPHNDLKNIGHGRYETRNNKKHEKKQTNKLGRSRNRGTSCGGGQGQ